MLGGADNPNGELLSYIIGADMSCLLLTKCGMALYCLWTERMNPNR